MARSHHGGGRCAAEILDRIGDAAKAVDRHFDLAELPGHPHRLYLPAAQLDAMMSCTCPPHNSTP